MRNHLVLALYSFLILVTSTLSAQVNQRLPGCEPAANVQKALDERLGDKALQNLKFSETLVLRHQVLEELMLKYPREIEPARQLIDYARENQLDELSSLQERFQKQAQDNPQDPLALDLAARALWHKDTAESLRLLESSTTLAPNFAWPYFDLAEILSEGKRADKQRSAENLARFYGLCPGHAASLAQSLLSKAGDPALQAKVAADLRARLLHETIPERLEAYEVLWSLEFRVRPPQEHDALRKQIAEDLKRLEKLNSHPNADWLALLIQGYRQSGAVQETITQMEDRLLSLYPHSSQACYIDYQRWDGSHKQPENQGDAVAWAKYFHTVTETMRKWLADCSEPSFPTKFLWFDTVSRDDSAPREERIAAMDEYLKDREDRFAPAFWLPGYLDAAEFLVDHKWQPERALQLMRQASAILAKQEEQTRLDDNLSPQQLQGSKDQQTWFSLQVLLLRLQAAKLAGNPEQAKVVRAAVEGPLPEKKYQSDYWRCRARLADLEDRKADALAYYRLALQTRMEPPKVHHGKLQDEISDEARAEWKELGGSEEAWASWDGSPDAKNNVQEAQEGDWERPKREMPAFELADLSGKTWRLKKLNGKVLLINVWATWCHFCLEELPHLEELYEQLKSRSDVQILTFNVDDELGLVAPYLKEKGYTFPVLLAHDLVYGMLDPVTLPRNWILDSKGTWQWEWSSYLPT